MDAKANAVELSNIMMRKEHRILSKGTDNHMFIWNVEKSGISGCALQAVCDNVDIAMDLHAGTKECRCSNEVCIGLNAMTSRGCKMGDMKEVASFLERSL